MIDCKGSQFEKELSLWGVRWDVAYPIRYRQLEERMGERGGSVDHATRNRWVLKYAPECEKPFRRRQQPMGKGWRMDETYRAQQRPGEIFVARGRHRGPHP